MQNRMKVCLKELPAADLPLSVFFPKDTSCGLSSPPLLSPLKKCYVLTEISIPKAKRIVSYWHLKTTKSSSAEPHLNNISGGCTTLCQSKSHIIELSL